MYVCLRWAVGGICTITVMMGKRIHMLFHHVSATLSGAPNSQTYNNWGSLRIVCTTACAIFINLFCGSDEVVLLKVSRGGTGVTLRVAFV